MSDRSKRVEPIAHKVVMWVLLGSGTIGLILLPCFFFGAMIGHTPEGTWENPAFRLKFWSFFSVPITMVIGGFLGGTVREAWGKLASWLFLMLPLVSVGGIYIADVWRDWGYDGEFLPRVVREDGPAPWIGPGVPVDRYVRRSDRGTRLQTRWDVGNGRIIAREFCNPIHDSFNEEVWNRLMEQAEYAREDGTKFTTEKYRPLATIVSLQPDVAIMTVVPHRITKPYAYSDWWDEEEDAELIGSGAHPYNGRNNIHPGSFRYYAGAQLPASDECYFASTDPEIGSGRLVFEDDVAQIRFTGGRLVITKSDDLLTVVRE